MIDPLIVRLLPGEDLRLALETRAAEINANWFLCSGIGSLRVAMLRYAGAKNGTELAGPLEILSLSGSVCADGAHLHAMLSDSTGAVRGGHLCAGCIIETTAELALLNVSGAELRREFDATTGYAELRVLPTDR